MVQEKLRLINNYKSYSYNGSKLRYLSLLLTLPK
jgi:hypothetical protein